MSPRHLLIDGHSVLFAWPELRALHQRQPRQAREDLIRQLRRFHDSGSWEVTVVFDGRMAGGSTEARRKGDLLVAYASRNQTADSVIEALVAAQKPEHRGGVTVITADGAERTTVEALGAYCMSPEWLRSEIAMVLADFEDDFARYRKREGR